MRVELIYFILGILFVQYIIPVLESLTSLLMVQIEAKKAGYSEIINDINLKIEKATASAEKTSVIGFQLPDEYEEEDEENED